MNDLQQFSILDLCICLKMVLSQNKQAVKPNMHQAGLSITIKYQYTVIFKKYTMSSNDTKFKVYWMTIKIDSVEPIQMILYQLNQNKHQA